MEMIGGHPYLIRLAMYELANKQVSLENLLRTAPTQEGIYSGHLLKLWHTLRQNLELLEAYKIVVTTSPNWVELNPMLTRWLSSLGLVNQQGNKVRPRNQLYNLYFRNFLQ